MSEEVNLVIARSYSLGNDISDNSIHKPLGKLSNMMTAYCGCLTLHRYTIFKIPCLSICPPAILFDLHNLDDSLITARCRPFKCYFFVTILFGM